MTTKEETRKAKKKIIIATWLKEAERQLRKRTPRDIYYLVYSLLVGSCEDEIYFDCDWVFNDAYDIVREAQLNVDPDRAAAAILRALRTRIPSPKAVGLRRCSHCRRLKPLSDFGGIDKYCRECRRIYNKYFR
jgi:hypothetical protein